MIPKGLFTQIAAVAISVGIILTYIQPTFENVGQTQDVISSYQTERGKVEGVNTELRRQISIVEGIPSSDRRALLTYMPDEVDGVSVMRDIEYIANEAGVIFSNIVDEGPVTVGETRSTRRNDFDTADKLPEDTAYPHAFAVSIEGSYQQIKQFLQLLEMSDYPLEVHSAQIELADGGFLAAEVQLQTYAHIEPVISQQ